MKKYLPKEIEPKWQKIWDEAGLYKAEDPTKSKKDKFYVLDMFPYPSGDGLHVGHFKGYTATDVISRFLRAKGFNVLHPMGWDAFGLPAENYAIKTGIHPRITTSKNIAHIRQQMKIVGLSYDWEREIDTTDPNYYKWTQWIFLQLYKKGLAYEAEAPINWCPRDKTGLANEEVVNGQCDRCGTKVVRKKIRQWILAITKYADRLLNDLDGLDWPESIVEMQKNWIGRSEGASIKFEIRNSKFEISVFTTRADTLFGATYVVLAPEHSLVLQITTPDQKKEVEAYIKMTAQKTDLQRTALEKEKTGVFTGAYAINPVDGQHIPVWIADYVLESYGTGAIMAVPAHDERDFEFAKKFKLPIVDVIGPKNGQKVEKDGAYEALGVLKNSSNYDGLTSEAAKEKITRDLEKKGKAKFKVSYKLRDWVFSRQRYWGEPIPIIHCQKCGTVPVDESELPLLLPEVEKYQPTGTGESPLAAIDEWVNVKCPNCGGDAKRETNTMPQWAGSCWYYLRFIDPKNGKELVSEKLEKYWMGPSLATSFAEASEVKKASLDTTSYAKATDFKKALEDKSEGKQNAENKVGGVDWYVGGAEHAVLHLLYARFWHKFLFDIGVVSTEEPFFKLRNVGLIMGPDGQKMSKSRGNVISPEQMVNSYGADTLRLFEMFIGPFGDVADWKPTAVEGIYRFLQRIWLLAFRVIESREEKSDESVVRQISRTIKKIEEDIWEMKFNTSVASMMEFVNFASRNIEKTGLDSLRKFLVVLAPFAPHMAEELFQILNGSEESDGSNKSEESGNRRIGESENRRNQRIGKDFVSIHQTEWPEWDEKLIEGNLVTIVVQVNGKVRDQFEAKRGLAKSDTEKLAKNLPKIDAYLSGKNIGKVIYVADKLINFVI